MTMYGGTIVEVSYGGVDLVEIMSVTPTETCELIESTAAGDTSKTYLPGHADATVAIECRVTVGDAVYEAVKPGESGALIIYPKGNSTGKPKISGTGIVMSRVPGITHNPQFTPLSVNLQITGGLETTTINK